MTRKASTDHRVDQQALTESAAELVPPGVDDVQETGTSVQAPTTGVDATPADIVGSEVPSVLASDPSRCIVVRIAPERERAFCSVDEGSREVEPPFRVNGRITEEEKVAHAGDEAAILGVIARRIARVIADEARQRNISVVRVANSEAGRLTAQALRDDGFRVVEFAE